jgi:hypothetical protein
MGMLNPSTPIMRSKQLSKLIDGEASANDDAAHGICIDRIVSRNDDRSLAVVHDDVLALPANDESDFLKGSDRVEVVDAWKFRHLSDRNLDFTKFGASGLLEGDFQVLTNRIGDVRQRLFFRFPLRGATWQARHPYCIAFFGV